MDSDGREDDRESKEWQGKGAKEWLQGVGRRAGKGAGPLPCTPSP